MRALQFVKLSEAQERAIAARGAAETKQRAAAQDLPPMTRRPTMDTARVLWSQTLQARPGLTKGQIRGLIVEAYARTGLSLDAAITTFLAATVLWCDCGFPQVGMSAQRAASLMATSMNAESAQSVTFPWEHFAIEVPPGTLTVLHPLGSIEPVDMVFVSRSEDTKSGERQYEVELFGNAGTVVHSARRRLADFDSPDGEDDGASILDMMPMDDRAVILASRLALGVAASMDSAKNRHLVQFGERSPRGGRTKRGRPTAWVFQLKGDVRVDCREWVTLFLRGGTGARAAVQSLVRGHHKRQPCGPNGADRRWIHVEPYWRGPEDAPIAVRSHVLGGT